MKGTYLAQWLSSKIKLRAPTALGMVKHPQVELQTNHRIQTEPAE